MTISREQLKSLPKYVQQHIENIERRMLKAEALASNAYASTEPMATDTILDPHGEFGAAGLPKGRVIRFHHTIIPEYGRVFPHWIDVRTVEDGIQIMGADTIQVEPRAGNTVHIRVSKRWRENGAGE